VRTLDRYLIRETIPPSLLALGIFTFVLAVEPMLKSAGLLLAKGVPLETVGIMLLLLLPQALGLTIPMAFLGGLLMALGRLSGDREAMALLACGVSPLRLLRPVLLLAVVVGGLDLYVMVQAVPDANQHYREITIRLLRQMTDKDIKPGLFYEGFPGKVLYVKAARPGGGWSGVFLADTSQPGRPAVTLAEAGQFTLDEPGQRVVLSLFEAQQYVPGTDAEVYDLSRTTSSAPVTFSIKAAEVFGTGNIDRGLPEMYIADLQKAIADQHRAGLSGREAVMYLHQKFSFPVACLVFALIGLAVGLHTRKEGKLAGMTVGLAIIFFYYAVMALAQSTTKGNMLPPEWARWVPNLVLGPMGAVALWWRARAPNADVSVPMPQWAARMLTRPPAVAPNAPGRRPRVVLVVRVPRGLLPRPRLLDLYVCGRYLRMAVLAFLGLLVLYYIATVLDLSEKVFKGQATPAMIAQYLWFSTPQFVAYVIPIATLVAVLATIGGLTRTNELTVMRACGVSLYRAAAPLVMLALLWSGVLFLLQERVVAQANQRADALKDRIRGGTGARPVNIANRSWLAGSTGRVYHYVGFRERPGPPTLIGLSIFETTSAPYGLRSHTYANHILYQEGTWRADTGWVQRFSGGGGNQGLREEFSRAALDLPTPAAFGAAQVDADLMTFGELRDYIKRLGASGFSIAQQQVQLHSKIAFPLATVVMTLLGVPFGVTTGRRGALYGIGLAVGLAVGYWLLAYFFIALGSAAVLPAPLAAWATNILFLALAVFLVLTVRT
jgi:LPS export ABC transporter permease LptG/LPS export ABC transporter permease LptF